MLVPSHRQCQAEYWGSYEPQGTMGKTEGVAFGKAVSIRAWVGTEKVAYCWNHSSE